MIDVMNGSSVSARRMLRREEMRQYGSELEWLFDPALVPDAAINYWGDNSPAYSDPFLNVSQWMIESFKRWSVERHARLPWGEAFEKYGLPNEDRVSVRESFRNYSDVAYGPGIAAMAEIFSVVPEIATREGHHPTSWSKIASDARHFGAEIAVDGTDVQYFLREYLDGRNRGFEDAIRFDTSKLKLHADTGITTVTPIEMLVRATTKFRDEHLTPEKPIGVCAALQAKVDGTDGRTMYDLVWDAYGDVAGRLIYPNLTLPSNKDIPAESAPESEEDYKIKLLQLLEVTKLRDLELATLQLLAKWA